MIELELLSLAPNSIYGRWYEIEADGKKFKGTAEDCMDWLWHGGYMRDDDEQEDSHD